MELRANVFSELRQALGDVRIPHKGLAVFRRLNQPKAWRRAIAVINIALVLLTANFAAEIFWTWAQPTDSHAAVGAAAYAPWDEAGADYRRLSMFDPFHRTTTVKGPALVEATRETTLDLKLFGLRAGTADEHSGAIIRTPDKRQGAFRVGDVIMDGVTLRRVLPDRVVIAHRGVLESLYLDDDATRTITAEQIVTVEQAMTAGQVSASPSALPQTGSLIVGINDAEALMSAITFIPRLGGRGINGFTLTPGDDEFLFHKIGFQPGDVLLAVNGMRLTNIERVSEIKDELRNAVSVQLEIERDGAKRIIELSNEE